jgi:hypothetical protein
VDLETPIGDFGLIMNGCVGDEVDRWDVRLGSPQEAIRLATCGDLNDPYVIVVEDTIGNGADITSESDPDVRALSCRRPVAAASSLSVRWRGRLSVSQRLRQ